MDKIMNAVKNDAGGGLKTCQTNAQKNKPVFSPLDNGSIYWQKPVPSYDGVLPCSLRRTFLPSCIITKGPTEEQQLQRYGAAR